MVGPPRERCADAAAAAPPPAGIWCSGRLALARALLAPFDALALDEPFTGLDRENRDLALACIRETAGDRPVLLVTHDAADAAGSPVVTL